MLRSRHGRRKNDFLTRARGLDLSESRAHFYSMNQQLTIYIGVRLEFDLGFSS